MLNTFQYAKGYVRIKITGFGLERFMNMAAFRGVYLWDVQRTPDGVELNVTIKGFEMLKGCARKTMCRTRIIQKNGLPFLLHRYRKRKLLMGGVAFFVLGLFFLSSFVWRIEIEGNETLSHNTVMVFLEEQGLRVGAPKFRLSDKRLQQSLLTNFTEISWANVHTRGTRTVVQLAEALPPQEIINRQIPTHVVAAAEGLITNVITWSGAPIVKQGDVVREGEMLISGILELEPDTPGTPLVYVHAYAEVWARRYYPIEFTVPFTYSEKFFTGQTATTRSLQLLFLKNKRITLPRGGNTFTSYDKITTHHQPGVSGNYPLPVVLAVTHYREFVWIPRTRTAEEAKALAEAMITGRIIREFDFATDIVDRRVDFYETTDALQVRALITTHQRIDRQIAIGVD
ncbi:MAG: sporulation protein YqfD [Firmicutes bacterium]|nr:sporulation protein YqfD [Bacillota bacterium]